MNLQKEQIWEDPSKIYFQLTHAKDAYEFYSESWHKYEIPFLDYLIDIYVPPLSLFPENMHALLNKIDLGSSKLITIREELANSNALYLWKHRIANFH